MQKIECLTNGIANMKMTNMMGIIIGIIIALFILILFNIMIIKEDKKREAKEALERQKLIERQDKDINLDKEDQYEQNNSK